MFARGAPPIWAAAGVWLALIGATLAALSFIPQVTPAGAPLFTQAEIVKAAYSPYGVAPADMATDHTILIESSGPNRSAGLRLRLPAHDPELGADYFLLRAEVKGSDLEPSALPWETGRLFMVRFGGSVDDPNGETAYAAALKRDRDWRRVRAHLPVLEPGQRGFLAAELLRTGGVLEVRGLTLGLAHPHQGRALALTLLASAWAAAILGTGLRLAGTLTRPAPCLTLLAALAIVSVLTLAPGGVRERLLAALGQGGAVDELVHFAMFAGLTAIAAWAWPRASVLALAAACLLFAGSSELMQSLSPGRTPSLEDFQTDASGVLCGAIVALLIRVRNSFRTG
ncbi:MAG: VanZ family protein [Pseudomonadota bacterium]